MPTVLRSPWPDIVKALLAGLAKYTPLGTNYIKPYRDGADLPLMDSARDIVVQCGIPVPDEPTVVGAGRIDTRLTRLVTITARTQSEADSVSSDYIRLLDPLLGHYGLEESVIDAMQMFAPTDTAGNELLVQPARLVPPSELPARPIPRAGNWTASALVWSVVYMANLDQSRQWG